LRHIEFTNVAHFEGLTINISLGPNLEVPYDDLPWR
jgi:hypothetical protein